MYMLLEEIFFRNALKFLIKNKRTMNNLYPYIWTHPF